MSVDILVVWESRKGAEVAITTKDLAIGTTYTVDFTLVDKNTLQGPGDFTLTRSN